MEKLKNKIKELKGRDLRLDIFKELSVQEAKELLLLANIQVADCIEALNYEELGIHHYEFLTGNIDNDYNKEVLKVDFHYNGDIYASIRRKTILNLFN